VPQPLQVIHPLALVQGLALDLVFGSFHKIQQTIEE
jgi:hypothetical protein